jgi:predicted Zn-dependent peptidase
MLRITFLFLFIASVGFSQDKDKNKVNDPLNVKTFVLKNGLTVMLSENHNTPQVFGVVAVKAGGKNDPKDATGMAHYLEHMLFKGTKTLGTWNYEAEAVHLKEIENLYEQLGKTTDAKQRAEIQTKINDAAVKAGEYAIPNEMDRMLSEIGSTKVNAFTTEDFTAYYNEFPANKLDEWLQIYDHRFEEPVFRLFQSELETVYEEKNRSMDSPFSAVLDEFNKNFWKNHPYGQQPIIGFTEHLKNPSLQKMYEYFNTYYVANNMVLALSGDFDTEQAMVMIEKYFGDWRTGQVPVFPNYDEKEFNGKEAITIKATPVKAVIRGYRSPKNGHPDQIPLQLVNYLLSNGEGSGFLDNLATEGKITFTGLIPFEYNDYGASILFVVPKIVGQSFEEAEKLVDEQLAKVKTGDFSDQLFNGAKLSIQKNFERQLEDNESRALLLVNAYTSNSTWNTYLSNYQVIQDLSKEKIVEIAKKYMGDNYLALYSKMGSPKKDKLSKPGFQPVLPKDGKNSIFYQQWKETPASKLELKNIEFRKDITRSSLAKNVELASIQNPFNQLFNLQYKWKIGYLHAPQLTYLASYLNKVGTESQSASAFKQALFSNGASMYFRVTEDEFILDVEGLDENFDKTLTLIQKFIAEVKVDQAIIKIIANEVKSDRKLNYKDLGYQLKACSEFALYGKQSTFLNELSIEELEKLSADELVKTFQLVRNHGIDIHYSGSLHHQRLMRSLEKLGGIKDASEPQKEKVIRPFQGFDKNRVYFLNDKKAVQTQIMFLMDGKLVSLPEVAQMNAFNLYFGGDMSSLVFQEIREYRSLAYSTSAQFTKPSNPKMNAYFYAFVGCQGDKTEEAMSVMYDLIRNMPEKRERELAIRNALISEAYASKPGFRSLIDNIKKWEEMGYTIDPNFTLIPGYENISFDQIVAFYTQKIKDQPVQVVLVGNKKKFNVDLLKKYGEVVELQKKQILKF